MSEDFLIPTEFIRHKRLLRAVLLEDQCWFCAYDLGRLIASPYLAERVQRNLDDNQFRPAPGEPYRKMLRGPTESLSVLKWQGVLWVPYRHWPELSARLES